jgi:hypothetical protein
MTSRNTVVFPDLIKIQCACRLCGEVKDPAKHLWAITTFATFVLCVPLIPRSNDSVYYKPKQALGRLPASKLEAFTALLRLPGPAVAIRRPSKAAGTPLL